MSHSITHSECASENCEHNLHKMPFKSKIVFDCNCPFDCADNYPHIDEIKLNRFW